MLIADPIRRMSEQPTSETSLFRFKCRNALPTIVQSIRRMAIMSDIRNFAQRISSYKIPIPQLK
jgi:hypothetical protein